MDDEILIEFEEPSPLEQFERRSILEEIAQRCTALGIENESGEYVYEVPDDDDVSQEATEQYVTLRVPKGRDFRRVSVDESFPQLAELRTTTFERWRFIDGYEAIWSTEEGTIECALAPVMGNHELYRLKREIDPATKPALLPGGEVPRVEFPRVAGGPAVSFGAGSVQFAALTGRNRAVTLQVHNLTLQTHDEARLTLEKVGNAVLFNLDLAFEAPHYLAEEKASGLLRRASRSTPATLQPPTYQYDREPMALYWYARTARGMPLLQYLAYYQALEFYFPAYSEREAHRAVQDLLKDPRFDSERGADIAKLITLTRGVGGRGFGDERGQLRSTIFACVGAHELRAFIQADDDRASFLSAKRPTIHIASHQIPVGNESADLRQDVAERIYEIRCRIVHTKGGTEPDTEIMLPFSKEARSLGQDLALIAFVVREVMIAASRPLHL